MKRRILFVDDEVNILKGLQRSLRPLRKYWDMAFAEGGENALDSLEKEPFDVIVSDMRMPEMDGAKLMGIVQKKYPKMVRIILSGHSDHEMIMRSVKLAHQYLTKPCEKKLLVTAITQACSLRDILNHEKLTTMLGSIETMPSLPVMYSQILEELGSEDASAESVGKIISKDIGMTAKVLQLVNSSFFGMPRHISDAKEAVVLLGFDIVKTLVLGIEVFSKFSEKALSIVSVEKIYDHSVKTGGIAKQIAILEGMDKKVIDDVMIASILHDLGKLILAQYFTDKYKEVMELVQKKFIPIFKAEKEVLGVTHAEVGAYLLGLWGLPDKIIEGIAFHHQPSRFAGREFSICDVVHVAELMEHHERKQPGAWQSLTGLDTDHAETLGILEKIPLWRDSLQQL